MIPITGMLAVQPEPSSKQLVDQAAHAGTAEKMLKFFLGPLFWFLSPCRIPFNSHDDGH